MDSASSQLIEDICSSDPVRVANGLQAAATLQETLAPLLLAKLEEVSSQPSVWIKAKNGWSPIFLFYLAAAWRERRAHPLLATLLRLPAKQCDALLGDFITEGARCVLADTWPGDLNAMGRVALDSSADPFARGTALNAAALLAARGHIARDEVLALFSRVAVSPLDPDIENDSTTATGLVSAIMDLNAWELRGTVITLFERDLVDYSWVGDETEVLEKLEPGTKFSIDSYRFPPPITNAWEAVKSWHFFAPLRTGRKSVRPQEAALTGENATAEPGLNLGEQVLKGTEPKVPFPSPAKPGRNDPCSCGSGKKYKKCCGA